MASSSAGQSASALHHVYSTRSVCTEEEEAGVCVRVVWEEKLRTAVDWRLTHWPHPCISVRQLSVALSGPWYFYLERRLALLTCITPITTGRKGENQISFFFVNNHTYLLLKKSERSLPVYQRLRSPSASLSLSLSVIVVLLFDFVMFLSLSENRSF